MIGECPKIFVCINSNGWIALANDNGKGRRWCLEIKQVQHKALWFFWDKNMLQTWDNLVWIVKLGWSSQACHRSSLSTRFMKTAKSRASEEDEDNWGVLRVDIDHSYISLEEIPCEFLDP